MDAFGDENQQPEAGDGFFDDGDAVVVHNGSTGFDAEPTDNGFADDHGFNDEEAESGMPDFTASLDGDGANLPATSVTPVPTPAMEQALSQMHTASLPKEEPETTRMWREKHKAMLEEKDARETKMKEELKDQAKKELQDWYKKYEDQLSKTKSMNRQSEKTFVAEMDPIEPGTEWDRVGKLCDFSAKPVKGAKDTSRMKSILLQLKQNPRPVHAK